MFSELYQIVPLTPPVASRQIPLSWEKTMMSETQSPSQRFCNKRANDTVRLQSRVTIGGNAGHALVSDVETTPNGNELIRWDRFPRSHLEGQMAKRMDRTSLSNR